MKILFATSNENKIAEAKVALGSLGHDVARLLMVNLLILSNLRRMTLKLFLNLK